MREGVRERRRRRRRRACLLFALQLSSSDRSTLGVE